MYQKIDVWKPIYEEVAIRYQCLMRLSDSMYGVSNCDGIWKNDKEDAIRKSEGMFLELLWDGDPDERCEWYSTLAEAVAAFDAEFGWVLGDKRPKYHSLKADGDE